MFSAERIHMMYETKFVGEIDIRDPPNMNETGFLSMKRPYYGMNFAVAMRRLIRCTKRGFKSSNYGAIRAHSDNQGCNELSLICLMLQIIILKLKPSWTWNKVNSVYGIYKACVRLSMRLSYVSMKSDGNCRIKKNLANKNWLLLIGKMSFIALCSTHNTN